MVRLALACLLLLWMAGNASAASTHFYVVGHADDWQLFMNPTAFKDVRFGGGRVVFVYLTAGDAGAGIGRRAGARRTPYYLAREFGALRAVNFMASDPIPPRTRTSFRILNGNVLNNTIIGDTVSYFFRLPDGNVNGAGFAGTGFQSLERLYGGEAIVDIRQWNTYDDWLELVETLRQLVVTEAAGSSQVWVNVQDPDAPAWPDGHSDHIYAARAMLQAVHSLPCVGTARYLDYVTRDDILYPPNVGGNDLLVNAATWGATLSGLVDHGAPSTFDQTHNDWVDKIFIASSEAGIGDCAF